jgi:hypothetical protein
LVAPTARPRRRCRPHGTARAPYRLMDIRKAASERARLEPILGRWKLVGENAPSMEGEAPVRVEGAEQYEWIDGGYFVLGHWGRHWDDGHHSGVSVMGFEPEQAQHFTRNFDNMGFQRAYAIAIDGRTWRFEGDLERAVYRFSADGTSFTADWEIKQNGEWRKLCHLDASKL